MHETLLLAAIKDERCHCYRRHLPAGCNALDAYTDGTHVIFCGLPSGDENHNCDEMGCGSLDHVLYRIPLGDSGKGGDDA